MLRILKGGFNSGLTDKMYGDILSAAKSGKRVYLIVPEQETVTAEEEASLLLPPSAPLYFEATNFTRFANSVFRALGGIAGEYCTHSKKRLIMWRALSELSPLLTLTGGGEISAGMIDRASQAVAELDSHGISPTELSDASLCDSVKESARLTAKVDDLVKIASLYKKLLHEKYQDTADDLTEATKKLRENPEYLRGTVFFVEGFTSFTEPQYSLLSVLMQTCEVTVALAMPKLESSSYEFTELVDTEARLIGVADKADVGKTVSAIDGRALCSELLSEAEKLMLRQSGTTDRSCPNDGSVRIFEASTPYEEAAFVAADIRRRVEEGESFSDFAIIARNADSYRGIIDSALRDYRVPHYLSKRRNVDSFEAVKLIYTAYSAVSGGFSREDVMTYAKCGLSRLTDKEVDELELYCETWQIDGRGFSSGDEWTMNPDGYAPKSSSAISALIRINKAREKLMTPLCDFAAAIGDAVTVRDHATALFSLLEVLGVESSLAERASALRKIGETQAADDTEKLFDMICDSLDVIVSTVGNTSCSASAFLVQLRTVFSDCSIGSIPSNVDEVTVGSADMLRLRNKKHVYLIGVTLGVFPATVSEGNYFTDKDKEALSAAGLSFRADTVKRAARELYIFRRAFASASESVTLLYPRMSTKRSNLLPAEVISRLVELSDGRISVRRTSELAPLDFIYTPASALERLGALSEQDAEIMREMLADRGYERVARISRIPTENVSLSVSKELCERLFDGDLYLTQSRIDSYVDCPLAYFCRYELDLATNERAEWSAASIGTLVHAILENFFAAVKQRGLDVSALTEEDKRKMTAKAARVYLDTLFKDSNVGGARMKVLLARLERAALPVVDGLCRELAASGYKPVFFELKIKNGVAGSPEPVEIKTDERKVYVYGTIDRVDAYVDGSDTSDIYVRVIDYKTGSKIFSPKDLAEGRNLQMFLYLRSIVDTDSPDLKRALGGEPSSRILPGGVIYAHTTVSDVTVASDSPELERASIDKKQKRSGMILDDPISISAMSSDHLPLTFGKKGEIKSTDRLYTLDGWNKISETVEDSVRRVADGITHGRAEAPKKSEKNSPCEYCDFKHFCRNASIKPKK